MKKYLIKGLLALVVGGFTASCADKDGDYVPVGQQKATAYADAFKELIGGEVAPNHDWGFKKTSIIEDFSQTRAKTRDVNVNGNMWDSRPELGATEEDDVLSYMDMTLAQMDAQTPAHRYSKNFPVNMPNFFVTQVHTGDDYYGSAQDPNNKNVLGSSHMNELVIAITESAARTNNTIASNTLPEANSWHHVNNFNAGSSKDWGGNTKFVNMGTCDFAYHNSKDSRFHNRWIVVNGADIDAKYAGYYYVCFDFQSQVPDGQTDKTYFSFSGLNDSGTMQSGYNGEIEGFYQTAQDIIDAGITEIKGYDGKTRKIEDIENFTVTRWEHGDKIIPGDTNYSDWIIRLCAATPDSDETTTRTDRVERKRLVSQGRVFCEDLGTDAARMLTSDIDFNDAVFDAKIWRLGQFNVQYLNDTYDSESEYLEGIYTNGINQTTGIDYNVETEDVIVNGKFKYVAEICILAAGGTVPLKIGGNNGFEIHSKFGEGNNKTIGHTTIINTMGTPSESQFKALVNSDICNAVTTEVDITDLVKAALVKLKNDTKISLDIIPIEVMWTSDNHQSVGVLKAETEEDIYNAPQKLCVPIGTPWVYERIAITSAYGDFASYATTKSPLFWEGNNINGDLLYANGPQGMTAENGETGNVGSNPYYDQVVEQGESTTTVETVLWGNETSSYAFDSNGFWDSFNISTLDFAVGDEIRIYGTSSNPNDIWIHINLREKSDGSNAFDVYDGLMTFNSEGYMSFTVSYDFTQQLSHIMPSLGIWAKNMTINRITKCRTSN